MNTLTPKIVQSLLRQHLPEILAQLGYGELRLGIPVGDPDPCLLVSVPPQRIPALPPSVTVHTIDGPIDIPLKVSGDYEPSKLLEAAALRR